MMGSTTVTAIGVGATFFVGLANLIYSFHNSRKSLFINAITSERVKWMGELKSYISEFVALITIHDQKYVGKAGQERGEILDSIIKIGAKIKLHLNYRDSKDQEIMGLVERITDNVFKLFDILSLYERPEEKRMDYFMKISKASVDARVKNIIDEELKNNLKNIAENEIEDLVSKIYKRAVVEERLNYNEQINNDIKEARTQIVSDAKSLIEKTQRYLKDEWNRVKKEAEHGNLEKGLFDVEPISQYKGNCDS